jgi:hypothetical protein
MIEAYIGDFGHMIWGTLWRYWNRIYVVIGVEPILMMMMY